MSAKIFKLLDFFTNTKLCEVFGNVKLVHFTINIFLNWLFYFISDLHFCGMGRNLYGYSQWQGLWRGDWKRRKSWKLWQLYCRKYLHHYLPSIQFFGYCQHVYCRYFGKLLASKCLLSILIYYTSMYPI